jgi:hypothetical protein
MQSSELLGELNPSGHANSWRGWEGLMFRHQDADGLIVAMQGRHRGQCDSQRWCELAVDPQFTQRSLPPSTILGHFEDGSLALQLEQEHLGPRHASRKPLQQSIPALSAKGRKASRHQADVACPQTSSIRLALVVPLTAHRHHRGLWV